MAEFDQFANQGGRAAGDPEEAAAAQAKADELLRSAGEGDSADFGGGPLGSHGSHGSHAEPESADDTESVEPDFAEPDFAKPDEV